MSSASVVLIASYDPRMINEIAAADDQVDYLNVELNGGATLTYKRNDGARGDLLQEVDATGQPVNATASRRSPGTARPALRAASTSTRPSRPDPRT